MITIGRFPYPDLILNEQVSGTIDSVNNVFGLSKKPKNYYDVLVFRNGLMLNEGLSNDFIVSGSSIIFNNGAFPQQGDFLKVSYLE